MVGFREIPRTATFTWSPGTSSPYLATGTKAGAVDEGFSNDTQLEIWDLDLGDTTRGRPLKPIGSISTDSRFNDIAWTKNGASNSWGIIAGALENGSLDLWDADQLINGQGDAFMSRTSKHSGSIKALQFNVFRSELLATVGAKGELFISDVNNVSSPFRMGNAVARADDFECLDWNKRTSHIMATGSSGGTMTIWDIKNKRESLTLNNLGRKPVSAVAWDPVKTTRLTTAIPNDTDPVVLVWDLRNANAPERILKGHDGGVLSLSWCQQDSDLLLSCGKDNRNICWNPQTGESYGEFPVSTNWTFQTRWNPHNPSFIATASLDGKISVHSIQSTQPDTESQAGLQSQTIDDEDFFDNAQSQPQGTTFTLKKAPQWLQRPCSASFGFGGKIVTFRSSAAEANKRSTVRISMYAVDATVVSSTESFETSLKQNDLHNICDSRIAEATDDADKADWKVIRALTSKHTRKDLIDYLGFSNQEDEATDGISKLSMSGEEVQESQAHDSMIQPGSKANRLSAFFNNSADGDNFLSEVAATRGAKTNNPFQIYTGSESEADRRITRALLLGKFQRALDVCLQERRMSDAFMVAICGGQSCIENVQKAYFDQKGEGPNYLRLLASVVAKNLWDLVHNADVESWKEVMAALCTYADAKEFPDLCEVLGDRLEEQMKAQGHYANGRRDAAFCFLAGSKLEKVVDIWLSELQEKEIAAADELSKASAFSIHTQSLQTFIEKVTVFREVTQYEDDRQDSASNWKLAPLYDKYIEYADIASAQGQLHIAERYLDLLPSKYAAADIAKSRVKTATQKPGPQIASQQSTAAGRGRQRTPQGAMDFQQQQQQQQPKTIPSPPFQANPYAPASIAQPRAPYATTSGQPYGGSSHAGHQQRHQMGQPPPPNPGAAYVAQYQNGPPRPPPDFNASPSVPPPSKAANMGNWNDMPDSFFKHPTASRRGTPGVPTNGPTPFQPTQPLFSQQVGQPPKSTPPLGPPPKAGEGPQQASLPQTNASQTYSQPDRPPSTNPYMPSQSSLQVQQQSTILRGPSPYNASPSAPPPSSRYAPSQPATSALPEPPMMGGQPPPPSNPYALQQNSRLAHHSGPASQQAIPPSGPPQRSTVPPSAPPHGASQSSRPSTAQSQRKAPAPSKYPLGDRSHIPSSAQPIYEILNNDMERIKSRAPTSFKAQVNDTEKRLNILFDHLNNGSLLKPDTIASMADLALAIQAKDFETAQAIHVDIMTNKTDECGNWMVGVKRLIAMSRATP
ncbi:MAG: hypothetical protein Q9217_002711 [Psora testacea]